MADCQEWVMHGRKTRIIGISIDAKPVSCRPPDEHLKAPAGWPEAQKRVMLIETGAYEGKVAIHILRHADGLIA